MKFTSALLAVTALCGATGANAAVRYEFVTTAPPGTYPNRESYGSFTFTADDYIASYAGVLATSLDSCSVTQPVSYACALVYFNPLTGAGDSTIQFVSESPMGVWYSSQFVFAGGALGAPGTYTSIINPFNPFSAAVVATLRVSTVAAAAVPEPATWALMLAGFGMVGVGLRRRGVVNTTVSYA